MAWITVLALSALFVVLNGIYVAAEFALIAAPRTTLKTRADHGDRFARRLLDIQTDPNRQDRYVATAQLGITLASLGLGMYGEHQLATLLEPLLGPIPWIGAAALASGLSLAFLTIVHIVLGEMIPKGVALQHPEPTAKFAHLPMQITLYALYPFVTISNQIAWLVLRVFGISRHAHSSEHSYTPEELQIIVEESGEGGAIREESGHILRELFEFNDLTASQVMVPRVRVAGIPVGATPAALRKIISRYRHTRYAVYDGDLDHVVGMLHVKDLLKRLLSNEAVSAADVRRIPVVPTTAPVDTVLAEMQRTNAHLALVIDEHGGTAGIISLEDLFEEVVGELDEGQEVAPPIVRDPDGTVRAAGTVRLDELGQFFDLDLSHDEVESVSGLVLARLDRPPVVGDVIIYDRIRLEVTAVMGRGVREVKATVVAV
ncbi:MAG TPA: hemolysin family protein [Vicinamibacterales bacterium]|nr:hemolysin family protein [Vicinamibacterales bacterium]